MPAPYHRLKIKTLKFISAVDAGAQGPIANVALIKRAPQGRSAVEATCRVIKTDEKLGLVFGWALATSLDGGRTPHVDLQDDAIVGDDALIKAAAEFMESGAAADVLHDENVDGKIVFAMPLTKQVNDALGIKSDVHGLAIAMKPSAETFKRFLKGELNAFSIGGLGERELVKRLRPTAKAVWTTAFIDDLPDSSFLYVEPGGEKDEDGKTKPRSLRHFPYKDSSGSIDLPHLRNAIARIPQSSLPEDKRTALQSKARGLLDKAEKRLRKQAVLTSTVDGHAHVIDLDDPADEWRDTLSTSYQTSEGATQSHCHAWTFDPDTGAITIAADSGHTHTVSATVPDDVRAEAAQQEDGERCRSCGAMCDDDDRYCPMCGAEMNGGCVQKPVVEPEGSGPTIIIAARATGKCADCGGYMAAGDEKCPSCGATAKRYSPPSEATPTVKRESKEPTTMADQNNEIAELKKQNARLEKMAQLSDAQRAHFTKLTGSDAEAFLAKSSHERDIILADIEKANEVVYTSTVDGAVYRKNDDRRLIEMAKRADAAELAKRQADKAAAEAEFAKRGETILKHFPAGTKKDLRGRVMKAINAEFVDPAEYEEVIAALKGHDEAMRILGNPRGLDGGNASDNSIQKRLDTKIAEYAKAHGLRPEVALIQATANDPEIRDLYNQAQAAGN